MKPRPHIAQIDNRWRARRIALALAQLARSREGARYYQAIYDHSFFIV
jgi:hypothetical protein